MKKIFFLLIVSTFLNQNNANELSTTHALDQIHKWADVLNIEGGTIAQKLCPNQKWFNVATILDRPYIDGVEFDYMAKNKQYDLKESAIHDYNEPQNFFVHVTLLKYCIDNAHQISNKKIDEPVKIIVQVHRPKSGIKYIKILNDIINAAYPEFASYKKIDGKLLNEVFIYELPQNISINFRYGSDLNSLVDYQCADIVISISLVAGFNANFKPGDVVIPTNFVPMDLDTMVLKYSERYTVKNYLFDYLEKIVDHQDLNLLEIINKNFTSPNKNKSKLLATKFTENDFNVVTGLHVNKNFSPSLLPKEFKVKRFLSDQRKELLNIDIYTGSYNEMESVKLSLKKGISGVNPDPKDIYIVDTPELNFKFYKLSYGFSVDSTCPSPKDMAKILKWHFKKNLPTISARMHIQHFFPLKS